MSNRNRRARKPASTRYDSSSESASSPQKISKTSPSKVPVPSEPLIENVEMNIGNGPYEVFPATPFVAPPCVSFVLSPEDKAAAKASKVNVSSPPRQSAASSSNAGQTEAQARLNLSPLSDPFSSLQNSTATGDPSDEDKRPAQVDATPPSAQDDPIVATPPRVATQPMTPPNAAPFNPPAPSLFVNAGAIDEAFWHRLESMLDQKLDKKIETQVAAHVQESVSGIDRRVRSMEASMASMQSTIQQLTTSLSASNVNASHVPNGQSSSPFVFGQVSAPQSAAASEHGSYTPRNVFGSPEMQPPAARSMGAWGSPLPPSFGGSASPVGHLPPGASSPVFPPTPPPVFPTTPPPVAGDNYRRPVDPTVLRISCRETVSNAEIKKLVSSLLLGADIADQITEIEAVGNGRLFVIHFAGPVDSAQRRVTKVLNAQRTGPGEWARHYCKGVGGSQVQMYLNADKNDWTVRMEMSWKALHRILQEEVPNQRFEFRKAEGRVTASWKDLCVISSANRASTRLLWHPTKPTALGLDIKKVADLFSLEFGDSDVTTWAAAQ